jgi:hypothetical protein
LADWTDHGIYRAAYLSLFDPDERDILRRAGIILAEQAISGDTSDDPVVVSHFRAAIDDARMLAEFLREIAEKAVGTEIPTRAGRRLAREARRWYVSAADLVSNLEAVFHEATGLAVDEEDHEPEDAPDEYRAYAKEVLHHVRALLTFARKVETEDPDDLVRPAADRVAATLEVLETAIGEKPGGE